MSDKQNNEQLANLIEKIREFTDYYSYPTTPPGDDVQEATSLLEGLFREVTKEQLFKEIVTQPSDSQKSVAAYFELALKSVKKATGIPATEEQEARLLVEISKTYDTIGEWDKALENCHKAAEMGQRLGVKEISASALKQIGHIYSMRGKCELAMERYQESIELFRETGNMREVGIIYNSIAFNYFQQGKPEAHQYYDMALEIGENLDDTQLLADANSGKGIIADMEGRWNEAIAHFQQSLPRYEALEDTIGMAHAYHNLAMTYAHQRNWGKANKYYEKSFVFGKEIGEVRLMASIYINRSELYLELFDTEIAEALARRALEIFVKLDDRFGQAEVYKIYGKILRRREEYDKAARFFKESIELFEACENLLGVAEAYHEFGLMCADKGEEENAQNYLRRASQLFEQLGASKALEQVNQKLESLGN